MRQARRCSRKVVGNAFQLSLFLGCGEPGPRDLLQAAAAFSPNTNNIQASCGGTIGYPPHGAKPGVNSALEKVGSVVGPIKPRRAFWDQDSDVGMPHLATRNDAIHLC